ncbi:kinase [Thraustotheca clavata]|uniref:Kinase n=1 Tax=Thraustotheca clavata TaxID=74557 RepID=A0A1W0A5G8_9STRA|nr:kinase [Thraustotheca clavata]
MVRCCSPYIIGVVAIQRNMKKYPLMALQYMNCGNLRQYLDAKRDNLSTKIKVTALEVAWVVSNALVDLHHNDIIHCDIKSANILLSIEHYIKLCDFELSREIREFNPSMATYLSTPLWTAPEALRSEAVYNFKADIYSFGMVLTELDTQHLPYSELALNGVEIMRGVSSGLLRPSLTATCAPWLKEMVDKCLLFDPKLRPTAYQIVELLQQELYDWKKTPVAQPYQSLSQFSINR